jgi:hypothetical protein
MVKAQELCKTLTNVRNCYDWAGSSNAKDEDQVS